MPARRRRHLPLSFRLSDGGALTLDYCGQKNFPLMIAAFYGVLCTVVLSLAAQASDNPIPLLDWLSRAGVIGILAYFIIAFLRGSIHSDKDFQRIVADRDRALDIIYRQLDVTRRTVDLTAERLAVEEEILALRRKGE
jgi:hypothetical protein